MEAIETPLAQGVAAPITPTAHTVEAPRRTSEDVSDTANAESVESNEGRDFDSDSILESVKDEGVEKTLLDLASDEPEQEKNGDEKEINDDQDETKEEEKTPLELKFENLSKKFEEQNNELKEVQKKVSRLEETSLSKEDFLEALLILAELKKAEEEEDKLSLLELFIKAMTRILVEVAPKEDGEYEDAEPVDIKQGHEKREKKKKNVNDIRAELMAKGLIRRPAVENQAA